MQTTFEKVGSNVLEDGETISNLTTTSGSFKTLKSFSVTTPGKYILTVTAPFAAGNGVRILLVDVTETDSNNARNSVLAEGRATLQKTMMFSLNTTDTVYIRVYQNSGSDMSVGAYYRLMRIG